MITIVLKSAKEPSCPTSEERFLNNSPPANIAKLTR